MDIILFAISGITGMGPIIPGIMPGAPENPT